MSSRGSALITTKNIQKLLYYSSICYLIIYGASWLLVKFTPAEFVDSTYPLIIDLFVPVAIAFTTTGINLFRKNSSTHITLRIGLTSVIFVVVTISILFSGALFFCTANYNKVLFYNKKDPSIRLVQRSFGCGAVDSTPEIKTICRVEDLGFSMIYVTTIDTSTIDRSLWNEVKR